MNPKVIGITVFLVAVVAIGGFLYFQGKETGGNTIIIPTFTGTNGIGITLYDSHHIVIKSLSDTSSQMALYQVNDFKNVYSMSIGGQICSSVPEIYYVRVSAGTASGDAIMNAINMAPMTNQVGYDDSGKPVAKLIQDDCAKFSTGEIKLDDVGNGTYMVTYSAFLFRAYDPTSKTLSAMAGSVQANTLKLVIGKTAEGVTADISLIPTSGSSQTTTTPSGGVTTTVPSGGATTTVPTTTVPQTVSGTITWQSPQPVSSCWYGGCNKMDVQLYPSCCPAPYSYCIWEYSGVTKQLTPDSGAGKLSGKTDTCKVTGYI